MQSKFSRPRLALTRAVGLSAVAVVAVLVVSSAVSAQTQPQPDRTTGRELPAHVAELKLETPEATTADLVRPGLARQGSDKVIVRLSAEPGAAAWVAGRDEFNARRAAREQQEAFIGRVKSIDPDARMLGRVQLVMNAVFVEVDVSKLTELAKDPAVVRIAPVGDYEIDLKETVPYIGAEAVQKQKITGKGIKVAVIDSGIDYTHKALGGSGNPAEYAANDPTIIEPGSFPTKKVEGGFDFVGSLWTGATGGPAEAPDPDPLDDGATNPANIGVGHGTHVAHIIGGTGGVAPGVDLYAIKACSSVSSSCSGIALIRGMEFAIDPNGDGRVRDRVDIINMSLGSPYGQPFDDDLSLAVDNATKFGTLTVAAAGNSGDKPYSAGTPAAAPTALSVAQTQVPSALGQYLQVNGANYPAVFQPWSAPLTTELSGPMQYGDGAGGNLDGCAPFDAGSLTGAIVLVDRGTCSFSIKITNIAAGGALAGVIGLITPGSPFEGGFAGGDPSIPGYMISQANADAIKDAIPVQGTLSPENPPSLVKQMVGSSSRGPQHENTQLIKPEIGAPGGSVSAVAGSGAGEEPFGGTSGAAPMVTGSAALVMQKFGGSKRPLAGRPLLNALIPGISPGEVKARLMNNGETDITNEFSSDLAPITRIGGGEVRVDDAVDARVAAWDEDDPTAALGFGFVDVTDKVALTKKVVVRNYDKLRFHTLKVTPSFRFADDQARGAVTVSAPNSVKVKPGLAGDTTFEVTLTIDGSKLEGNYMNSGTEGANPTGLTRNEYDGYITLDDGKQSLHLPWHVLPRKAAKVVPSTTAITPGSFPQIVGLDNQGVGTAQNDAYDLIATSPNIPEGGQGGEAPTPDIRAVGINTFVGGPGCSFIWAFAINTWERQEHLVPVVHNVLLDTNQDGKADYDVFNFDQSFSGSLSDGRQLTWAQNLSNGSTSAFFYAEHSTNTGSTVLYICAEQVGMSDADLPDFAVNPPVPGKQVDVAVVTEDFYYGGPGDTVEDLTVMPLGERFYGIPTDVDGNTNDPGGLAVYDFGAFPGNTDELGLMLLTNGDRSYIAPDMHGGATKATESLLFTTP